MLCLPRTPYHPPGTLREILAYPSKTATFAAAAYANALLRLKLDRLVPLLTTATADGRSNRIVGTGIKVIDVMCPIRAGGSVAIAGEYGTGNTVNMEELVRRISGGSDPVTLFLFLPPPSEI